MSMYFTFVGKSTMLKIIMGVETANEGYVEFGSGNIVPAYYAQNQVDTLDLDHTVLESVMDAASGEMSITDVRTLLGQFMFKGEDVQKKIRSLSGGEKARVALCRIMLTPANLLLMDEVLLINIIINLFFFTFPSLCSQLTIWISLRKRC